MRLNPPKRKRAEIRTFRIFSFTLFILTFSVFLFAQDAARVGATWQVDRYDIAVQMPASDADRNVAIKATLNLRNISSAPASTLTLRISPNATVSTAMLNGTAVDFSKGQDTLGTGTLQRLSFRMPAVAPGAALSVVVDYKLAVKENSGLASLSAIGAQFLPLSYWYPTPNSWYFARGADFAPTRIQVTGGQTLVGSGTESAGAFDQKYFVQPFFVSGSWDKVTGTGVDVFVPKESDADAKQRASEVAALANEARSYFAGMLGKAPDTPLRIVAVKRGGGFASGGTILMDDSVLRRGKLDATTAMNISDASAKLWFADSVRVAGDGYGVVREGLSRFFATQFLENKYGKGAADVERMRQRVAYSIVSQRDAPLTLVAPLDDSYFSAVAYKGAMIWRVLSRRVGSDEFNKRIASALQDGIVTLAEVRAAFPEQTEFLDAMLTKVTDTNLLIGLPQQGSGETKAALRNTGTTDVTVNIAATTANGEKIIAPATIRATSFSEVTFKTPNKVVRLEIDTEKLYPQTDYSDDVAPRETNESDLQLAVKRAFDKQDFAAAETAARIALREYPSFDDVRVLYGRTLLALNRNAEAEKEFKAALDEKLPTARTIAWANLGLAETASRGGQSAAAMKFAESAIRADAEYGATLAARVLRNKISAASEVPDDIKAYFSSFDRAAISGRKTEVEALVVPGEASRFVSGISGQAVEWKTTPTHVDRLDANTLLVETQMAIRMLNRQNESGMAVYRMVRMPSGWKIYSAEIFEVR